MAPIDDLVPGFTRSVAAVPANARSWQILSQAVGRSSLGPRTAALIGVAVAQRVGCDYGKWVMERIAARNWIRPEEVFFAGIGIGHGQADDAAIRAAARLATRDRRQMDAVHADIARTLGADRAADILSQVSLAMLTCEVLESVAPGNAAASARTRQGED